MQRYLIESEQVQKGQIIITNDDVHHIKNVMRMKPGEIVCCFDQKMSYLCELKEVAKIAVLDIISSEEINNELSVEVTIAHGIVSRDKTEEVIRRLTELGCYQYIPVAMKRCSAKRKENKEERYKKIVKEATEQSRRTKVMKVKKPMTLAEIIKMKQSFDLCLYANLEDTYVDLKQKCHTFTGKSIIVIIGPEGGFDIGESKLLKDNGFLPISLGKMVLRTETAPLYIMSVLGYECGEKYES